MEFYCCLPIILSPRTFNLIRENNALEIVTFCWRNLYKTGLRETIRNIRGGSARQTMNPVFFKQIIPKSNLL